MPGVERGDDVLVPDLVDRRAWRGAHRPTPESDVGAQFFFCAPVIFL
jgi:hypothetical protein